MPDSTDFEFDQRLVDWVPAEETGYSAEVARLDGIASFAAAGMVDFPNHLWIEPKHWKDYARENDEYKTWPDDYRNRFTNQSPTHECTCHSLLQNMEIAWNRQRKSKADAVYLSALSVYAEANPRIRGGASVVGVMQIAMRRGMLPDVNGPRGRGTQADIFNAALTCSAGNSERDGGPWVPVNRFPSGWENTARHFRPLEVINVETWEQHCCLVLQGYCVSNGRSGHAIPHVRIVWRDGELFSQYSDSYDLYRYDSVRSIKSGANYAYAIASTTVPDDWKRPAGSDMRQTIPNAA